MKAAVALNPNSLEFGEGLKRVEEEMSNSPATGHKFNLEYHATAEDSS